MGEKYFLRPVREQDLRILLAWRNSERIHSTMLTDHIITWDEHVGWFEVSRNIKPARHLIFEHADRPIGYIGYTEYDEIRKTCSPGAYIGETERVPLDAGLNLFFLAVEYACMVLQMKQIETSVFSDNRKAIKLDELLGYKRLSGQDKIYEKNYEKKRAYRYAMTKDEWVARRPLFVDDVSCDVMTYIAD